MELTGAQWDTGLHRYSLPLAPLPPPLWTLILSLNLLMQKKSNKMHEKGGCCWKFVQCYYS